jgi:UrcA family protein
MKGIPMRNSKLQAIACAVLVMSAVHFDVASAQDAVPAIHIPLAGIDLASAAGRKALDGRIKSAAEDICSETTVATLLRPTRCIAEVIESVHARRDGLIADYQAAQLDRARTIPTPVVTAQGADATSAQ